MPAVLVSIHYLRGIVALMIVLFHCTAQWQRLGGGGVPGIVALGSARVDIFFVISGFVLWQVAARGGRVRDFIARRLLRVVPLYWLVTGFVLAVALAAPQVLSTTQLQPVHVAASFLFLAWPHPAYDMTAPLLIPGWTLNYEIAFYLLLGACLPLPGRARLLALWGVLGGLVLLGLATPGARPVAAFYADPIMLEFAAGATLGFAFAADGPRPHPVLALALAAAGLGALLLSGQDAGLPRLLRWGGPACLIVGGLAFAERAARDRHWALPASALLGLTGAASFSIYLSHAITLPVVAKLWTLLALPVGDGFGAFALASLAAAWGAGIACHRLVEQPLRRLRWATPPLPRVPLPHSGAAPSA